VSRWVGVIALLGCLLAARGVSEAAERVLRGRVVDADGKGVAGASVALAWTTAPSGTMPLGGALTDLEGRFELTFAPGGEAAVLLAYDLKVTRGGTDVVQPGDAGRERTITLVPLVRVTGELSTDGGKAYPANGMCWVRDAEHSACLLRVTPDKGKFDLALPPGRYVLAAQAPGREAPPRTLELAAGAAPLQLGRLEVPAYEGRVRPGGVAPPIVFREASPALQQLLRDRHVPGRWTLLYFWDHT
jgi:hypothetical protein